MLLLACSPAVRQASAAPKEKKPEIILETPAHDRKAGEEGAEDVASAIGLLDNRVLNSFIQRVGERIVRYAPQTDFSYSFHVVDQDAPNAFALPGGFVYVSRGLLLLANSEAEVANVLGHEIAHVARRHAAARQTLIRGLPAILRPFAVGSFASYSREQEREADRIGQGMAGLAGYDPAAMSIFLRDLEFTERLRLGFSRLQGYLDTHPATSERTAAAGARARTIRWTPQPGVLQGPAAYLRLLDGLVVGIGASEGVVDRDRFLHADLGFSMRFPNGWDVLNTHAAVGAISPRRDAQVVLELQGPGDDPQLASQDYLAEAEREGLRIERAQPLRLGALPGYRVEGGARIPGGRVSVQITWFAREGSIYRLTGLWLGADTRASIIANVARSFRPITPAERRGIRETRLKIVEAEAGESLAALSKRTRNAWNLQETAVMNGIFADAELEAGQLVKIAATQAYGGAPAR